jgi:hypothetical protein
MARTHKVGDFLSICVSHVEVLAATQVQRSCGMCQGIMTKNEQVACSFDANFINDMFT